ncbi:hypothetical protein I7I50_00850 [Histoplasma capsulatum G186AR]|uniref:Uncharacterized protein n=1 Tax=Ajellomyces capsulatus TaxID=5037 RepID=A0A8H8CV43_AJECA|nr:hypothetical protein I7I52_08118 [Histoplasma capsulatum]QSS72869.1 hypothetical protein I7I50_00850 [Histoplasma capsulatum G186AR]
MDYPVRAIPCLCSEYRYCLTWPGPALIGLVFGGQLVRSTKVFCRSIIVADVKLAKTEFSATP